MKTLNFDNFEMYVITSKEMNSVRGGEDGEPTPTPPPTPILIEQ